MHSIRWTGSWKASSTKVLTNTCSEDAQLFIDSKTIFPQEGTIQANPLTMAMYAIAINPLIDSLHLVTQVWYADDASAFGSVKSVSHGGMVLQLYSHNNYG